MRHVMIGLALTAAAGSAFGQCGGWRQGDGVPGIVGRSEWTSYARVIETWDPDGAGPIPERLILAGDYQAVASIVTGAPVSWDGTEWYEHPGIAARDLKGFASVNGTLYALGSTIHRWNGFGWDEMPGVMANPAGLAGFDGWLYATGVFASPGGPISGLVRLNEEEWEYVGPGATSRLYAEDDRLVVVGVGNWLGDRWGDPSGAFSELVPYRDYDLYVRSEFLGASYYQTWIESRSPRGIRDFGSRWGARYEVPSVNFSVNDRYVGYAVGVDHTIHYWTESLFDWNPWGAFSYYLDSSFDESGYVTALRSLGSQTLVSGRMSQAGRYHGPFRGVANAVIMRPPDEFVPLLNRGIDAPVELGTVGGKLIAVGALDVADGQSTNGAAERRAGRWVPNLFGSVEPSFWDVRSSGEIFVAGKVGWGYGLYAFDGVGWLVLPGCAQSFGDFASLNGRIYFSTYQGQPSGLFAIDWGVCGLAHPAGPNQASLPTVHSGAIHYLEGSNAIGRLGPAGPVTLGTLDITSGQVISIDSSSAGLVISGSFIATDSDQRPVRGIALWDGSGFRALGEGLPGEVEQAIEYDGAIFASVRGLGIYRWDWSVWTPLGGGISGSMAVADGLLHVGGDFLSREGGGSMYYATWSSGGEPTILETPAELTRCARNVAVLRVRADGPGLRYRWRLDGVPLEDGPTAHGSRVSGADTPRLSVERLSAEDEGVYTCEVSNGCGAIETPGARITVCFADVNCDGTVDTIDFFSFLHTYDTGTPTADINGDGNVDLIDFFAFFEGWNRGC